MKVDGTPDSETQAHESRSLQFGMKSLLVLTTIGATACACIRLRQEAVRFQKAADSWHEVAEAVDSAHANDYRLPEFTRVLNETGVPVQDVVSDNEYSKTLRCIAARSIQRIEDALHPEHELHFQALFGCVDRQEFEQFGVAKLIAFQIRGLESLAESYGDQDSELYSRADLLRAVRTHSDISLRYLATPTSWIGHSASESNFLDQGMSPGEHAQRLISLSSASGFSLAELGVTEECLANAMEKCCTQQRTIDAKLLARLLAEHESENTRSFQDLYLKTPH